MKFQTCLVIIYLCISTASAQIKPLKLGDRLPNDIMVDLINSSNSKVNLNTYQGKLFILDFWATWCSPCVAMIPKTDSLQREFKDKVQFLPVTNEDKNTVLGFTSRLKKQTGKNMVSVINDKYLNQLFIHSSIPFYAWINGNGELIATTEASEINRKNLTKALNGDMTGTKNIIGQPVMDVDNKKPLFQEALELTDTDGNKRLQNVNTSDIIMHSVVTKYIPNIRAVLNWDTVHFTAVNAAVLNIYRLSYGLNYKKSPFLFWSKSRCIIEVKDPIKRLKINSDAVGDDYEQWLKINGFNYDLIWNAYKKWPDKRNFLLDDVDRNFGKPLGIKAELQKRLTPSDVLSLTDSNKQLSTQGGTPFERHDAYSYVQKNLPLSHFINLLQDYFWQSSDRPVIDETKFSKNVDLELNCKMTDIEAVNKELLKYNLKFTEAERDADVLIIKDR